MSSFPWVETDVRIELDLDGDGVYEENITEYAQVSSDGATATISRGAQSEGSAAPTASCALTLRNGDARFSKRNPTGPYWGQLTGNTPLRVSIPHDESRLIVPEGVASGLTAPDSASLSITGDLEVRVDLELPDWTSSGSSTGQTIIRKWQSGGQRSWALAHDGDGYLALYWSEGGTTYTHLTATALMPAGRRRSTLIVTLDVDNGAGGHDVAFYVADSLTGAQTQIGETVTGSGTTSIYDGTADVTIGDNGGGRERIQVFGAMILDGIAGTPVSTLDLTGVTEGATTVEDVEGNTWTLRTGARLEARDVRFAGVVPSWEPTGGVIADDSEVAVVAYDELRRIGRSKSPSTSIYRRACTSDDSDVTDLVQYVPMEDAAGAARLASALVGKPMMLIWAGEPQLASDASFAGSDPLPVLDDATILTVSVPTYSHAGDWRVMALVKLPAAGIGGTKRLLRVLTSNDSTRRWDIYATDAGSLSLHVTSSGGASVYSGGPWSFDANGLPLRIGLSVEQVGADVTFILSTLEAGETTGTYTTDTISSVTTGRITSVTIAPDAGLADCVAGHLTMQSVTGASVFDAYQQLGAYIGEEVGARVRRLCADISIPSIVRGGDDLRLGPQGGGRTLDLLRIVETTDGGILHSTRTERGLTYRSRDSICAQVPALSTTCDTSGVTAARPVEGDRRTANLITVTRTGGSATTVEQTSGPLSTQDPPDGVGVYDTSVELNLRVDDDLARRSGWELHMGTIDAPRYPAIGFDLAAPVFMTDEAGAYDDVKAAIRGLDVGDRLQLSSPPAYIGVDDVDQVAVGFVEAIGPWRHTIDVVCLPYEPYRVAVYDDLDECDDCRYSAEGTLTATAAAGSVTFAGSQCRSHAATQQAGDLSVEVLVQLTDWTPASEQAIIARYDNAGGANERSWALVATSTGYLHLYLSTDGSSYTTATSTQAHGISDGVAQWVRWDYIEQSGAALFYLSDDGVQWSQLGEDVPSSAVGGLYDADADFQLGARSGTALTSSMIGTAYAVRIRDGRAYGDAPEAAEVGADMDTSWTVHSGNLYIDSGPVLYENYKFENCRVRVRTGDGATFRNCWFAGNSTLTSEHGLLDCTHDDCADVTATNCTFLPETPTAYMAGILGHNFHLKDCLIRNCVDGVGVYNTATGMGDAETGVIVDHCWIGDHAWFSTAPGQPDGSHCDGVQMQGGAGTVVRNCTLYSYNDTSVGDSPWSRVDDTEYRALSSMMLTPNVGDITDCQIYGNHLLGGEISVNATAAGNASNDLGAWVNNRWADDQFYDTYTLDFLATAVVTCAENTYDDSSTLTIRPGGTSNPVSGTRGALLADEDPADWTDGYDGAGTGSTAAAASDDEILVVAPGGVEWTHDDGDYEITADGEDMLVTGVTGTAPNFALEVTRGINGVIKTHDAGIAVDVKYPCYYGV